MFAPRTLLALLIALAAAAAAFLLSGGGESALAVLAVSVAAVLVAASGGDGDAPATGGIAGEREDSVDAADLIEAIFEPVLIVADTRVAHANRAARGLLGQHILGQDVRLAIRHPAAAERLLDPEDAMPGAPVHLVGLGTRDQHWEMRMRSFAGGTRVVHLTDRTGSHAAERMRVDFVANASHELRTPLASLLGFIETLGEEAGEDPAIRARFLTIMSNEAQRMQRLVNDLISLSRIEAEKYRVPDQQVDLGALVEEVHAEMRAANPERGQDLAIDVELIASIQGDMAQLSQLLHNIIGNAMKYGRAGTPVVTALRQQGNMAVLSVTDQGDGIAPEHLPRLTERFYRADAGRSRAAGGTGLGLAIVKHIVERHRGRLDVASTVGTGTTVTIFLPSGEPVIKA